jgi:hypothetical protein
MKRYRPCYLLHSIERMGTLRRKPEYRGRKHAVQSREYDNRISLMLYPYTLSFLELIFYGARGRRDVCLLDIVTHIGLRGRNPGGNVTAFVLECNCRSRGNS